ncbi:MAG: type IV pilus modification protein PilV [Xanthomonadaceae bacterium]|nr:type IV pilus modification protein PilV [Xanthomonadaceae bacterium]MDP2184328.1 type IV pilus modification protein PilV [Xanthomonadales bacterium]MDZ4377649.1 type IV pilus modification protein PilV [Xanthomonadaceae bacterium]
MTQRDKQDAVANTGGRHHAGVLVRGSTLVEVLVALLIMGIGMLGIASLQATSLRNSQMSLQRSQAVIAAYNMMDAMRANRAMAMDGRYNMDHTCVVPVGDGLAASDRRIWLQSMQVALGPEACGSIDCEGINCTITIVWSSSHGANDGNAQSVTTRSQL